MIHLTGTAINRDYIIDALRQLKFAACYRCDMEQCEPIGSECQVSICMSMFPKDILNEVGWVRRGVIGAETYNLISVAEEIIESCDY